MVLRSLCQFSLGGRSWPSWLLPVTGGRARAERAGWTAAALGRRLLDEAPGPSGFWAWSPRTKFCPLGKSLAKVTTPPQASETQGWETTFLSVHASRGHVIWHRCWEGKLAAFNHWG